MAERKLTKAEEERLEIFNRKSEELLSKGYESKSLVVSAVKANTVSMIYGFLLSLPFVVIFNLLNRNTNAFEIGENYSRNNLLFFVLYIISIVVHELLHGFTWSLFAKDGFKSIAFGVIWKTLNPYCTCKETLNYKQYFLGLIMPCIVLGIIPCIISLFYHNAWYLAYGVIMIMSASGDLMIARLLLSNRNPDALYLDHPTDIGLVCFEKK